MKTITKHTVETTRPQVTEEPDGSFTFHGELAEALMQAAERKGMSFDDYVIMAVENYCRERLLG